MDMSVHRPQALRGERYYSRDFAHKEMEAVWSKCWLVICRVDQIPQEGDFLVEDIGSDSILIVRQPDESIKAFYNVCQHRGNRLVSVEQGSIGAFTCAYHSWKWSLEGVCIDAQDPEDFVGGSPCGRKTLAGIQSRIFAGFVWINMDPDAGTLEEYLGEVAAPMAAFPFETMRRTQALSVRMPCNWKIICDNFRETYHIPTAHPEGLYVNEPYYKAEVIENLSNGHSKLVTPGSQPSVYLGGELKIDDFLKEDLKTWGLDPDDFVDRPLAVRQAIIDQKRLLGPARGHTHYDRMDDRQLTDTVLFSVFPNTTFACFSDGMLFLRGLPNASDPERCTFDSWFYAVGSEDFFSKMMTSAGSAHADPTAEVEREWRNYGEGSLGVILDGDAGIMEAQQKGLHSRGWKGAELAGQEKRIAHYHDRIDELIDMHVG